MCSFKNKDKGFCLIPCRGSWHWSRMFERFWSQSSCNFRPAAPALGAGWNLHSSSPPRMQMSRSWCRDGCCSLAPQMSAWIGSRSVGDGASWLSSSEMEKKLLKLYTSLVITTHKYCLKWNISELNRLLYSFDSYLAWPKVKKKQHVTAFLLEVTKLFFFYFEYCWWIAHNKTRNKIK